MELCSWVYIPGVLQEEGCGQAHTCTVHTLAGIVLQTLRCTLQTQPTAA
jgi:hypothetical protein